MVAAPHGLGTINHTLLTVEAARAAGLDVAGVVMTPWPGEPSAIESSNRATVERLAGVPVTDCRAATRTRSPEPGARSRSTTGYRSGRVYRGRMAEQERPHHLGSRPGPDREDIPELIRKLQERKARHKQRHPVHRAGVVVVGFLISASGSCCPGRACPGPASP